MQQLFVVGTDTGVGKTYVTCQMARCLQTMGAAVGIYKPVCSGAEEDSRGEWMWDDVERAWSALDGVFDRQLICPQRFFAPLAPNVAAQREGRKVDAQLLKTGYERWQRVLASLSRPILLIEGAGGWLSPIAEQQTVADLAACFRAPVLVVAPQRLGTINHVLLTLESVRRRGLSVVGVVLNCVTSNADASAETNAAQIERLGEVPVLTTLSHGGHLTIDESWLKSLADGRIEGK